MNEPKRLPEIGLVRCRDLALAEEKLNDFADLGYEVTTTVATVMEDGGLVYLWTLRLRPEVRDDRPSLAERPTLSDRVKALAALINDHADHHAGWDNGILSRLDGLDAASDGRARTLANMQDRIEFLEAAVQRLTVEQSHLCTTCGGTGRQIIGTADYGPITAGCSVCDGTGRAPGHE